MMFVRLVGYLISTLLLMLVISLITGDCFGEVSQRTWPMFLMGFGVYEIAILWKERKHSARGRTDS